MSVTAVVRKTSDSAKSYYFKNIAYSRTTETEGGTLLNLWQCANTYYWLGAQDNYTFYAVAPWNALSQGLTINTDGAEPVLSYTVPASAADQFDIIADKTIEYPGNHNKAVPLSFKHLLSRIIINVPQRDDLATGTITNIEISNVVRSGSYSMTSQVWTLTADDIFTFKLQPNVAYTPGAELTGNGRQLFLIPQTLDEGSIITITFKDTTKGTIRTYTKSLGGLTWQKGLTYTFNIGITPDDSFEFTQDTPILDANYVMHTNTIRPVNVIESQQWIAKVRSNDGAPVTIQREADVNVLVKDGFWADRLLDTNGNDVGSARGTDQITSTGAAEVPVRIFLPENSGDKNRIIYIDFYLGASATGQPVCTLTLLQYCPDWVGTYGWEQIDDNGTGNFGFEWDRKVCLTYKYSVGSNYFASENDIVTNRNYKYADGVRQSYPGYDRWTSMGWFWNTKQLNNRCYILLDYSKLNQLIGSNSRIDGLANTVWLNQYGGEAATMAMENSILSIMKTQNGQTTETAFRIATVADDGRNAPPSTLTSPELASDIALSHALMKNKYNLKKTGTAAGDMGYVPVLTDIVWYLPAVDQFKALPKLEPINPGDYWSSTVEPGADTNPYDGAGIQRERNDTTWLKIRACRNRP